MIDVEKNLTRDKPNIIIENACMGFIKRYRGKDNYSQHNFMADLGNTKDHINIYV